MEWRACWSQLLTSAPSPPPTHDRSRTTIPQLVHWIGRTATGAELGTESPGSVYFDWEGKPQQQHRRPAQPPPPRTVVLCQNRTAESHFRICRFRAGMSPTIVGRALANGALTTLGLLRAKASPRRSTSRITPGSRSRSPTSALATPVAAAGRGGPSP